MRFSAPGECSSTAGLGGPIPASSCCSRASAHLSANPVIDVDGGTATAETDFAVLQRDDDGRARVALVGRYRDRLRKDDDGQWVFVQRTGVSLARPGEAGTDSEWQRALARTGETVEQERRK